MVQTDGTGRHNSVNLGLFSVKMPNLGVHFVLKGKHSFCEFFSCPQCIYNILDPLKLQLKGIIAV